MFARRSIYSLPTVTSFIDIYCQKQHVSTSVINSLDQLKGVGADRLEQYANTLQQFGFSRQRSNSILSKCPQIAAIPPNRLEQQFQNIKSLGFKDDEIKEMVIKEPVTLVQNPNQFRRNFTYLLKELGEQDGRRVAVHNPSVLSVNHVTVKEKIDYCISEMGLLKSVIAKTGILELDLDLIKIRHVLAYRAGYYKRPNKKKPEISEDNPSYSDLYLTSDEDYIKKMKGITLEELLVLEAMIKLEDCNNNEIEDEDGEDYEDEEDDDKADLPSRSH